jgi:hypothetical protein
LVLGGRGRNATGFKFRALNRPLELPQKFAPVFICGGLSWPFPKWLDVRKTPAMTREKDSTHSTKAPPLFLVLERTAASGPCLSILLAALRGAVGIYVSLPYALVLSDYYRQCASG